MATGVSRHVALLAILIVLCCSGVVGVEPQGGAAGACKVQLAPAFAQAGEETCMDEALQQIVAATPVRSTPPSASSPFIFFHARKCAGTSLRAHIATSALASGLPPQQVLVPGAHPVRYDVYTPSVLTPAEASRIAVAGFHISWGRDGFLGVQQPVAPSRHRSCVTVLRDPIDRVVSCYYHRFFYGIQPQRHMWEWAPAELIHILIHFVDQWGDGCLNELLRIFSGYEHSAVINRAGNQVLYGQPASELDTVLATRSILNMAQCALAVLLPAASPSNDTSSHPPPRYDVLHALRRWHPWLLPGPLRRVMPNKNMRPQDALGQLQRSPQHWEVLQRLTALERYVYDAGRSILEFQDVELRRRQDAAQNVT